MRARSIFPAVTLVLAACGAPADTAADGPTRTTTTTTPAVSVSPAPIGTDCPVTIPEQPGFRPSVPADVGYSAALPEPDPYPRDYPHADMVWYGTDELWTALPIDGEYRWRKSVWWSVNFRGGIVEGEPEVQVTWTRLDADEPPIDNGGEATNAYTPEEGWFIIAGIDPAEPGCWRVEAEYKGASLSYVYLQP